MAKKEEKNIFEKVHDGDYLTVNEELWFILGWTAVFTILFCLGLIFLPSPHAPYPQ